MKLSPTAIAAFQKVYREECYGELSAADAQEIASRFLDLFKNIYQPIRRDYEKQT